MVIITVLVPVVIAVLVTTIKILIDGSVLIRRLTYLFYGVVSVAQIIILG